MNVLVTNCYGNHTAGNYFPIGLFYAANRLKELGQKFRFEDNLYGGNITTDDVLFISYLLNNHSTILNLKAQKLIIGGKGSFNNTTIPKNVEMLQIAGSSSNISTNDLKRTGKILKEGLPSDIEIPLIPSKYINTMRFITFNNGEGCSWGKCLFCKRGKPNHLSPRMTAINICEIYKKYGKQIQLSMDGPSKNYLLSIAANLLSLESMYGKVTWGCNIMANHFDDEFIKILCRSGCRSVGVGIEYLSDPVLNCIKKGITVSNVYNAMRLIQKFDMYGHFCVIDFSPYVLSMYIKEHNYNLHKLLGFNYCRLSFSINHLNSNVKLDKALNKMVGLV